jgi:alkanesulfonate monooxygenase
VKIGLAVQNFVGPSETPDIDEILRYSERAEALGFESLWAWDHVILGVEPSFPILDAVGTLTAIAARTSTIKLGTGVLVLPLRNPTVAAKALGTLDVISKGRLVLGVAAGWYAREFDAAGVPFTQRGRLFERNLEILTRLWSEDRVSLQADEFNLREAVMRPKPAQRPRPPILIGGYVDAVLRRVATKGDGWLTYFYTPESYTKSWEKIVAFAREAGRDPTALTGTNQLAILVGQSRAETEAPMRQWLQTEWDVAAWSASTIEHAIRGSVDECVDQLRAHVATGVDRLILIPYRYQPEQVERIAKDILPRLR